MWQGTRDKGLSALLVFQVMMKKLENWFERSGGIAIHPKPLLLTCIQCYKLLASIPSACNTRQPHKTCAICFIQLNCRCAVGSIAVWLRFPTYGEAALWATWVRVPARGPIPSLFYHDLLSVLLLCYLNKGKKPKDRTYKKHQCYSKKHLSTVRNIHDRPLF